MSAALSASCLPFQVNNMPMVVLVHPVFDCLMRLGKPDALVNEEEVRKNVFFFTLLTHSPFIVEHAKVTYESIVALILTDVASFLQVDCLVLQLHRIGEQLEKANSQRMDELFFLLRDGFLLQEGLTSMARLLLLEILEFRAGGWLLSGTAHKYYYSEIAD